MDYGYIGSNIIPTPNGSNKKYTQVYQATHKGENYLPFMQRSFISFSFDGKNIEDFNLIATIDGDRLQRKGYSEFEDLTSNYEILDGHFYWGTHYTNHTLDFSLSTDGITENELNNFLKWFQPGRTKELILSEHPNRAIMARVSSSPELHLLPFEEKTSKKIDGQLYYTSTTLYKGEISLSFTMEEPYWYSKINIFGYLDSETGVYRDVWIDANGIEQNIFNDPDAIKIALEDNIPIGSMIQDSMLLGNNTFADANEVSGAQIAELETYTETIINGEVSVAEEEMEHLVEQARIAVEENDVWIFGARIAGTIMSESTGIQTFAANENQYFYYAGNAPTKPIIQFTLTPNFDENGYISNPKNKYSSQEIPYNTFSFESLNKKELQFTTPSLYTGYNQVIDIFRKIEINDSWVNIRKQIRDFVNHPAARAWANKVIDTFNDLNEGKVANGDKEIVLTNMKFFLMDADGITPLDSTFIIDSKSGRATAKLGYRGVLKEAANDWLTYGNIYKIDGINDTRKEEDVGDMIRSNYLIIEDQNQPTENGNIVAWGDSNDKTRLHSHIIKHDVENGLKNVYIKYNNMYL